MATVLLDQNFGSSLLKNQLGSDITKIARTQGIIVALSQVEGKEDLINLTEAGYLSWRSVSQLGKERKHNDLLPLILKNAGPVWFVAYISDWNEMQMDVDEFVRDVWLEADDHPDESIIYLLKSGVTSSGAWMQRSLYYNLIVLGEACDIESVHSMLEKGFRNRPLFEDDLDVMMKYVSTFEDPVAAILDKFMTGHTHHLIVDDNDQLQGFVNNRGHMYRWEDGRFKLEYANAPTNLQYHSGGDITERDVNGIALNTFYTPLAKLSTAPMYTSMDTFPDTKYEFNCLLGSELTISYRASHWEFGPVTISKRFPSTEQSSALFQAGLVGIDAFHFIQDMIVAGRDDIELPEDMVELAQSIQYIAYWKRGTIVYSNDGNRYMSLENNTDEVQLTAENPLDLRLSLGSETIANIVPYNGFFYIDFQKIIPGAVLETERFLVKVNGDGITIGNSNPIPIFQLDVDQQLLWHAKLDML